MIYAYVILISRKFYSIDSSIYSPLLLRDNFFLNKNTPYPTPQSFNQIHPRSILNCNLKLLLVITIGVCWQSSVVPNVAFSPYLIFILNVPLLPVSNTSVYISEIEFRLGVGRESTFNIFWL